MDASDTELTEWRIWEDRRNARLERRTEGSGLAGLVPATKGGPMVAFEIRDIRVSSPEWRRKLILRMQPFERRRSLEDTHVNA